MPGRHPDKRKQGTRGPRRGDSREGLDPVGGGEGRLSAEPLSSLYLSVGWGVPGTLGAELFLAW